MSLLIQLSSTVSVMVDLLHPNHEAIVDPASRITVWYQITMQLLCLWPQWSLCFLPSCKNVCTQFHPTNHLWDPRPQHLLTVPGWYHLLCLQFLGWALSFVLV